MAEAQRPANASPADVLRRCGIKPQGEEDLWGALTRHAREKKWNKTTIKRWERKLQKAFAARAESTFSDLTKLNVWLVGLGLPKATSIKEARAALRTVHINIYDLLQGAYDKKHETVADLRKYTVKYSLIYPLQQAKDEGLRDFLRPFFGSRK